MSLKRCSEEVSSQLVITNSNKFLDQSRIDVGDKDIKWIHL